MENDDTLEIKVNKTSLKRDVSKLIAVALTGFAAERFAAALFDRVTNRESTAPTVEIDSE